MYTCTLYKNTGFNAVNIPDSKATLTLAPSVVAPALDIYQARELSSFVIKANYANIKDCDYLYLQNDTDQTDFAFYSIQNITMTSNDTAILNVTMDYILTAGGASSLTFLDGMCERHHVAVADDTFGAYCEEDPYLAPAETMKVQKNVYFAESHSDQMTIIASTIDLRKLYVDFETNNYGEGMDYQSTNGNTVTVPTVPVGSAKTYVTMDFKSLIAGTPNTLETALPGLHIYTTTKPSDASYTNWQRQQVLDPNSTISTTIPWVEIALSFVRSLGIESCIIAQYAVPAIYFRDNTSLFTLQDDGKFMNMESSSGLVDISQLPFNPYTAAYLYTVKNKRLIYGEYAKYHLLATATGNEAIFNPEDIYDATNQQAYPQIMSVADVRPSGSPYYNFRFYRGNDRLRGIPAGGSDPNHNIAKHYADFFCNCVRGLEWQNVPLVYTGASGSLVNQYKYNASIAARDQQQQATLESLDFAQTKGMVNGLGNMLGGALTVGAGAMMLATPATAMGGASMIASGIGQGLNAATDLAFQNADYNMQRNHANAEYNIAKNTELQSLLIANNIYAPSYNFPMSEGIRDFIGNSCTVWRAIYTQNDLNRIEKILTMYGYRHTTPIQASFLTNRAKFNYIKASGVSIGNTGLPKWLREGVATQFAAGTRIWHVLPDPAIYTNGTNV